MDAREVLRCPHCRLNQFLTANEMCRKCRKELKPQPEVITALAPQVVVLPHGGLTKGFAMAALIARLARGVSQYDVAKRMSVARTYISKVENGKALPTVKQIERYAAAVGTSAFGMVRMAEALA